MLLHSAPLTRGWNALLGAVRAGPEAPRARRLRGGALDVAHHELHHRWTEAQLDALRRHPAGDSGVFDETGRAVLRLALEMRVTVREATFRAVRERLEERGTVELVATVAAYNMVSRFLVAVAVEPE